MIETERLYRAIATSEYIAMASGARLARAVTTDASVGVRDRFLEDLITNAADARDARATLYDLLDAGR